MVPKSFTIFWGEELIEGEEGAIYYLLHQENGKKIRCRKLLDDTETAACSQTGSADKVTAPWLLGVLQAEIPCARQYVPSM